MSRSRSTLHKTKLDRFRDFLVARGWSQVKTKGFYEVLRMKKAGCEPLIVHEKIDAKEHYTTWGESEIELNEWFRQLRAQRRRYQS